MSGSQAEEAISTSCDSTAPSQRTRSPKPEAHVEPPIALEAPEAPSTHKDQAPLEDVSVPGKPIEPPPALESSTRTLASLNHGAATSPRGSGLIEIAQSTSNNLTAISPHHHSPMLPRPSGSAFAHHNTHNQNTNTSNQNTYNWYISNQHSTVNASPTRKNKQDLPHGTGSGASVLGFRSLVCLGESPCFWIMGISILVVCCAVLYGANVLINSITSSVRSIGSWTLGLWSFGLMRFPSFHNVSPEASSTMFTVTESSKISTIQPTPALGLPLGIEKALQDVQYWVSELNQLPGFQDQYSESGYTDHSNDPIAKLRGPAQNRELWDSLQQRLSELHEHIQSSFQPTYQQLAWLSVEIIKYSATELLPEPTVFQYLCARFKVCHRREKPSERLEAYLGRTEKLTREVIAACSGFPESCPISAVYSHLGSLITNNCNFQTTDGAIKGKLPALPLESHDSLREAILNIDSRRRHLCISFERLQTSLRELETSFKIFVTKWKKYLKMKLDLRNVQQSQEWDREWIEEREKELDETIRKMIEFLVQTLSQSWDVTVVV